MRLTRKGTTTGRSSKRLFCCLRDSQAMRYVGGSLLKTLLHEQARAGTVGEFLEPGG